MRFLLLLLWVAPLAANRIELFVYWLDQAKGQELFPISEGELPLVSRIRKELLNRGHDLFSWERERYLPWMLNWEMVHCWRDFQWWLGWNLPKPSPIGSETDFWVFWSLGQKTQDLNFRRAEKEKLILFLWEPPTTQPESHDPQVQDQFGKIFTWDDDLVDNQRFFKFYYPVMVPRIAQVVPFEEKKFCTLIAGRLCSKYPKSLYGEREKTIRFFEDKVGEFDLYGKFWQKRNFKNYRGEIPQKHEVLKNYKYCICYENTRDVKGYITEKIFDCFAVGCVPVYWGASNVTDVIPPECFIDRRKFQTEQELYDFLKSIGKEEYEGYLQAAEKFLQSETAQLFTEDHFVKTFLQITDKNHRGK